MTENKKSNSKKWQKILLLLLLAALGMWLLLFGSGGEESDGEARSNAQEEARADEYARSLEVRIAELCSHVDGVGRVEIFVGLSGGYRTVYAQDAQSSSSGYKSQLVTYGSGSAETAAVCMVRNPEISGVGIVCEGGGDAGLRNQLVSLVSASLGVSANKIYVAKLGV